MKRLNDRRAADDATGVGRDRRRERRPAWMRSWQRVEESLDASDRLINACIKAACVAQRRVKRRPVQSSRELLSAGRRLEVASARLQRAARLLSKATVAVASEPELSGHAAPDFIILATHRWIGVAENITQTANELFSLHQDVVDGLNSGELAPERPRILLTPRPAPVRAFLSLRLPRATDRISIVLHRRRRTPRPAAVRVPRKTSQGRAPPPFSSI